MDDAFETGFEECWEPIQREACACRKGARCAGCLADADLTLERHAPRPFVQDDEAKETE